MGINLENAYQNEYLRCISSVWHHGKKRLRNFESIVIKWRELNEIFACSIQIPQEATGMQLCLSLTCCMLHWVPTTSYRKNNDEEESSERKSKQLTGRKTQFRRAVFHIGWAKVRSNNSRVSMSVWQKQDKVTMSKRNISNEKKQRKKFRLSIRKKSFCSEK